MKRIILDTNFLLIPSQFKVDIFAEIGRICDFKHELFIIDKTIDELEKISNKHSKLALQLIKNKGIKKIGGGCSGVDSEIVNAADKNTIVATQDKILKKRLKNNVAGFIVLRQKRHLTLV